MGKLGLLIVGGAGYLLGSRAGREHYDKVAAQVQRLVQDPRVQKGAAQAKQSVKDKVDDVADSVTSNGAGGGGVTGSPLGTP
ncbi:MAG: YtxH domain-containing protein [Demequina sp.]